MSVAEYHSSAIRQRELTEKSPGLSYLKKNSTKNLLSNLTPQTGGDIKKLQASQSALDAELDPKVIFEQQKAIVMAGKIAELDFGQIPHSKQLILYEIDRKRLQQDYEVFKDKFEAPYNPITDENERREAYCLNSDVDRMIEMTDHMIRYRAEKENKEKIRRSKMSEKER